MRYSYLTGLPLWLLSTTLSAASVTLQVTGVMPDEKGTLMVGVYDREATFLKNDGRVAEAKSPTASAQDGVLVVKIDKLTLNKEYAIAVFHDANNNGLLDKDWLGMPKEGYGFSNNTQGTIGPLDFKSAAVKLIQENQSISVKLSY